MGFMKGYGLYAWPGSNCSHMFFATKKSMVHFSCLEAKYGTPGPGVIKQVLEKEKDTEWNKMCSQRSLSETFPIWVSHLLPPTPKSLCPSSRFESLKPQLGIVKSTLTWRWELDRTPLGWPKKLLPLEYLPATHVWALEMDPKKKALRAKVPQIQFLISCEKGRKS